MCFCFRLKKLFPKQGSLKGCFRNVKAQNSHIDLKRMTSSGVSFGCNSDLLVGKCSNAPHCLPSSCSLLVPLTPSSINSHLFWWFCLSVHVFSLMGWVEPSQLPPGERLGYPANPPTSHTPHLNWNMNFKPLAMVDVYWMSLLEPEMEENMFFCHDIKEHRRSNLKTKLFWAVNNFLPWNWHHINNNDNNNDEIIM